MAESMVLTTVSEPAIGEDYHKIIDWLQQQVAELMTVKETQSPAVHLHPPIATVNTTTSPIINYNALPYDMMPGHRLDGTNYHDWVHQLRSSLVGRGLLKLVLGKEEALPATATMAMVENRQ